MVTSEFPPCCGGIGWYVYYLCLEMRSRGHEISILQRSSHPLDSYKTYPRIPLAVGNIPLFNAIRMVSRVRAYQRHHPHDIAIVHSTPLGAWIKDLPTLLVVHCCLAECDQTIYRGAYDIKSMLHRTFGAIYREVERRSVHGADRVGVVSHAMQKEISSHYSVDAFYVGNGVNIRIFTPPLGYGQRAVLLPSLLRSGKGVREAVQTLQILRKKGNDIPFYFIGAGPMKSWLEKKIAALGLPGVELLPAVEHEMLTKLYQRSSVVFLPSYYEGLPTIALEAMATGLPVVATDVGGTSEAVCHGKTGFTHKVSDVEGMAMSIMALDRDDALRRRMGRAGLQRVHQDYTWNAIGNNFQTLINFMA